MHPKPDKQRTSAGTWVAWLLEAPIGFKEEFSKNCYDGVFPDMVQQELLWRASCRAIFYSPFYFTAFLPGKQLPDRRFLPNQPFSCFGTIPPVPIRHTGRGVVSVKGITSGHAGLERHFYFTY